MASSSVSFELPTWLCIGTAALIVVAVGVAAYAVASLVGQRDENLRRAVACETRFADMVGRLRQQEALMQQQQQQQQQQEAARGVVEGEQQQQQQQQIQLQQRHSGTWAPGAGRHLGPGFLGASGMIDRFGQEDRGRWTGEGRGAEVKMPEQQIVPIAA